MLNSQLVTVIILKKGQQNEFDHSMASIQQQTHRSFEVVTFCTETAVYNTLGEHLNQVIASSNGNYIALLNEGDTWRFNFLERCLVEIETCHFLPNMKGVVTGYKLRHEGVLAKIAKVKTKNGISLFEMMQKNNVHTSTFFYKKTAHDTIGFFNETLQHATIWEYTLRFLIQYEIGVIPEVMVNTTMTKTSPLEYDELVTYLKRTQSPLMPFLEMKSHLSRQTLRQMIRTDIKNLYYAIQ